MLVRGLITGCEMDFAGFSICTSYFEFVLSWCWSLLWGIQVVLTACGFVLCVSDEVQGNGLAGSFMPGCTVRPVEACCEDSSPYFRKAALCLDWGWLDAESKTFLSYSECLPPWRQVLNARTRRLRCTPISAHLRTIGVEELGEFVGFHNQTTLYNTITALRVYQAVETVTYANLCLNTSKNRRLINQGIPITFLVHSHTGSYTAPHQGPSTIRHWKSLLPASPISHSLELGKTHVHLLLCSFYAGMQS